MAIRLEDGSIQLNDGRTVFANSLIQGQDLIEILELLIPGYLPAPLWPFISGGGGGGGGVSGGGAAGPAGPAGAAGAAGAPGANGNQGNQGVQGPGVGAQGAQGNQGNIGVQGNQGAQGHQGPSQAGVQGPQGLTGLDGVQGFQGNQGAGSQGPQGSGSAGVQGNQGNQGAQGQLNPDIYAATRVVSLIAGDGTDLTIASAIAALPAEGGLIFVKQGTYPIAATLTMPDKNVVIRGAGDGATIVDIGANAIPAFTIPTGLTVQRTFTFEDIRVTGTGIASQRGFSVQDVNSRGVLILSRVETYEIRNPLEATDGGSSPVLIYANDCFFQQVVGDTSILIVNSPNFPTVNLTMDAVRFYRTYQDTVIGTFSQGGFLANFTNVNIIAKDSQFSIGSVDCTIGALNLDDCYVYNFAPVPNVRVAVADDSSAAISSAVVGCNLEFVDFHLSGTGTKFTSCRMSSCSFRDTAISSFTDCYFVGIGTSPATAVVDCVGDTSVVGCYFEDDAIGTSFVISDPSVVANCTIYGNPPTAAIELNSTFAEITGNLFDTAAVPIIEVGVASAMRHSITGNYFNAGAPTLLAGTLTLLDNENIRTFTTTPVTLDQLHRTVLSDATAGAKVINLPSAASSTQRVYTIKKIDASVNTVTIDGSGAETIDGATTQVLTAQYQSVTIQSNGTSWSII